MKSLLMVKSLGKYYYIPLPVDYDLCKYIKSLALFVSLLVGLVTSASIF